MGVILCMNSEVTNKCENVRSRGVLGAVSMLDGKIDGANADEPIFPFQGEPFIYDFPHPFVEAWVIKYP